MASTEITITLRVKARFRERCALRLLGWATWALPPGHAAIPLIYHAAGEITEQIIQRAEKI